MNRNFEAWVETNKDVCFRYWVHKIMFTPYEEDIKAKDQSCYKCDECSFGYIVEYVVLPDNDVLIGFSERKDADYISYYKLSAIDLEYSDTDNHD